MPADENPIEISSPGEPDAPPVVFISYSSLDQATAFAACHFLEENGIRCWIARRDIHPGADWSIEIMEAISLCTVLVLIFSEHSNKSDDVMAEVTAAVKSGLTIIPFKLQEVEPSKRLNYELFLKRRCHWLDAINPPLATHLKKLAAEVQHHLTYRTDQGSEVPSDPGSGPGSTAKVSEVKVVGDHSPGADPCLATLGDRTEQIRGVAWSPDGKILASAGEHRSAKLWDVTTGYCEATLRTSFLALINRSKVGPRAMTSVAWSPDGKTLAGTCTDETLKFWDTTTGRYKGDFVVNSDNVAWRPDGTTLAGSHGHTVMLWNPLPRRVGRQINAMLMGHTYRVTCVAWSPDGRTLASGSYDRTIKLWNPDSGQCKTTFTGDNFAIQHLAWSPDGTTIASASNRGAEYRNPNDTGFGVPIDERTIRLWDAATGKCKAYYTGHSKSATCVAWSPDGTLLASASNDKTIKLWDVATGTCKATCTAHTEDITSVAWSPDGKTLASGSLDKTIKLWNVSRLLQQ